jgi:2-dehydropantoate 2-reductase
MRDVMRVLVVGAGAVGSRFGGALHKGGAEVVLFDIMKDHLSAINVIGLEVHSDGKTDIYNLPACLSVDGLNGFTHIFIFTKSIHTESALKTIKKVITDDVILVTLQNGLGNIEMLRGIAPQCRIIAGVTNYAAGMVTPGIIDANGSGITKLQALEPADSKIAVEFAEVLHKGGMAGDVVYDIQHHIWGKIAFNAALNTITSLTGLSVGLVGATTETCEMAFNVAKDVAKTARAAGINISDDEVCDSIKSVMNPEMSANHYPSMFQDIAACRKTEVETICGKVLKIARKFDIQTPYLHSVYLLIRAIENNYSNRKG